MDIEKKKKKICSCHEKCSYCIVTSFSIESATVIAYLSEKISISNGALVITSARHCDQAQSTNIGFVQCFSLRIARKFVRVITRQFSFNLDR